ncbi:MAG: DUF1479 domain-containing protein [Bauldia sp.]|nr:DUF1479 domain-containing protein [Bauldia sp.]
MPSPAAASVFRTYQGWTALNPAGAARRHPPPHPARRGHFLRAISSAARRKSA